MNMIEIVQTLMYSCPTLFRWTNSAKLSWQLCHFGQAGLIFSPAKLTEYTCEQGIVCVSGKDYFKLIDWLEDPPASEILEIEKKLKVGHNAR